MKNAERIELLEEAQDCLHEAIELITDAVEDTGVQDYSYAYIIGHLKNWADGVNPYDETIPKLIEKFQKVEK